MSKGVKAAVKMATKKKGASKVQNKVKPGHRARKHVSAVIPTPTGGNHATRRKKVRAEARAEAEAKRDAHLELMAKQAEEVTARIAEANAAARAVEAPEQAAAVTK